MNTELNPGRELDALVAEKVMGFTVYRDTSGIGHPADTCTAPGSTERPLVPEFSANIAAAWGVVERISERLKSGEIPAQVRGDMGSGDTYYRFQRTGFQIRKSGGVYYAGFSCADGAHEDDRFLDDLFKAKTAPHAICLAALRVVTP